MAHCCSNVCLSADTAIAPRFRKALWIALVVNALMLLVEIAGSVSSGSVSLLADAVDFGGRHESDADSVRPREDLRADGFTFFRGESL